MCVQHVKMISENGVSVTCVVRSSQSEHVRKAERVESDDVSNARHRRGVERRTGELVVDARRAELVTQRAAGLRLLVQEAQSI